jgi:hypothetical protein
MPIPDWIRAALGIHKDNVAIGLTVQWILVFVLLVLLVYQIVRQLLASW